LYLHLINLFLISQVRKFSYVFILLILISFSGYCQILDDSTKEIYSSKTTQYFLQQDVVNNTNRKMNVDTSLLNLHNYNFYFKDNILYQDLGNFGTPLNRIYYEPPTAIGKRLGITTLAEYGYDPDKLKYYDTKSPYTKLFYIQGSRGQQSMEVEHSRNIKPNWNVGFLLKRMVSIKQIAVGDGKELQMSHWSFAAHTSYFSKNKRYSFLFSFTHLDHSQYETGGIFVDSTETKKDMFDYKLEKAQLYSLPNSRTSKTHLRSYYKSSNFRFYNEYSFTNSKALQLFHQFDYTSTVVRYDDDYLYDPNGVNFNSDYYPITLYDNEHTHDLITYRLFENKAGFKGQASKLFYMGYFRRKDFSYNQPNYPDFIDAQHQYNENFLGGKVEYRFTDTTIISLKGEQYLEGDYTLQATFFSKYMELGYNRISYSPTLFQLRNMSNSYQWQNSFSNTLTDFVYAKASLKVGNLLFSPFANYSNISNLIYYDTSATPTQSSRAVQMASVGFHGRINYKGLYLENYLRYTKISGADILRAPELFNQTKIYVNGAFKKVLKFQLGVDLSWKSGYYGNAYSPATQQFHLSDRSNNFNYLDGNLITDLYLNTQIRRAFIFLKLSNLTKGVKKFSSGYPSYFITPYYTGMPRSFEFGVKWLFYD
jgi:hypothetical protein